MAKKIYKAAPGAPFNDEQAQTVGEHLDKLPERTPAAIVEDAKRRSSPLHEFFEWDDSAAAAAHRLAQARRLIGCVRLVVRSEKGSNQIRAFHNIIVKTEQPDSLVKHRYISLSEAKGNKDAQAQIIENAKKELVGWRNRYSLYRQQFQGDKFFDALDEFLGDEKAELEEVEK